jgi:hypothetical protein
MVSCFYYKNENCFGFVVKLNLYFKGIAYLFPISTFFL